jgi:hypothetical protein
VHVKEEKKKSIIHNNTPHPTLPRSEAPSPELSEVENDLEPEANNDSELLNHFDSLKADF